MTSTYNYDSIQRQAARQRREDLRHALRQDYGARRYRITTRGGVEVVDVLRLADEGHREWRHLGSVHSVERELLWVED